MTVNITIDPKPRWYARRRNHVVAAAAVMLATAGTLALTLGGGGRTMLIQGAVKAPKYDYGNPGEKPASLNINGRLGGDERMYVQLCQVWAGMRPDKYMSNPDQANFAFTALGPEGEGMAGRDYMGIITASMFVMQDGTYVSSDDRQEMDYWCSGIYR